MSPFLLPPVRNRTFFLALTALLAFGVTSARAVDITECGQIVPKRQVANLIGDLNCSEPIAYAHGAVELEHRATLNLNGFSLVGADDFSQLRAVAGVYCHNRCKVNGPGTITGFFHGIQGYKKRVSVTDMTITGAWDNGLRGTAFKVTRCTISGSGGHGIKAASSFKSKVKVVDSSVSDNGGSGVVARQVRLRNATVTGNGGDGVRTLSILRKRAKVRVRDSVVVENGVDCPPEEPCYDINVSRGWKVNARLRRTTFGTCVPALRCRSR